MELQVRMIAVENYCKAYRDVQAVTDLSFVVEPGQVLGLVGPNGAGKTTTIRAITGIIPPTSGRLLVAGHDVVSEPMLAKKQLAYIPDDPKLFDLLTVHEHLRFSAEVYDVPEQDREPIFDELLERFNLIEKRDTPASQLSRGMRQKVAISCAYLHDPKAIMFDEPLTGLDPYAIRDLKTSVRERAAAGAAIMISSHLLSLVEDLCTHVLILDHGVRKFFGSLGDLRDEFSAADSFEDIFFLATGSRERHAVSGSPAPESGLCWGQSCTRLYGCSFSLGFVPGCGRYGC